MNLPDFGPADDPAAFKACCAGAYESPVLTYLLGSTWRPGGLGLTAEIARAANVSPSMRVLDVAAGRGETARLLDREHSARAVGVDLSSTNLRAATSHNDGASPDVVAADAEVLPFRSAVFDVAFCECSFCTFPDKTAALGEIARVLKPGGLLALADVSVEAGALPEELAGAWGRVACLADAMPAREYAGYVTRAGLEVTHMEDCRGAALEFVKGIDSRLMLVRLGQAIGKFDTHGVDIREARAVLKQAIALIEAGQVSYFYLLARKPVH